MLAGATLWKHCEGCGRLVTEDCCQKRTHRGLTVSREEGLALAQASIGKLRECGLTWTQIGETYGIERSSLRRVFLGEFFTLGKKMQRALGVKVIGPRTNVNYGQAICAYCGATYVRKVKTALTCSLPCRYSRMAWRRSVKNGSCSAKTAEEWRAYCDTRLSIRGHQ